MQTKRSLRLIISIFVLCLGAPVSAVKTKDSEEIERFAKRSSDSLLLNCEKTKVSDWIKRFEKNETDVQEQISKMGEPVFLALPGTSQFVQLVELFFPSLLPDEHGSKSIHTKCVADFNAFTKDRNSNRYRICMKAKYTGVQVKEAKSLEPKLLDPYLNCLKKLK